MRAWQYISGSVQSVEGLGETRVCVRGSTYRVLSKVWKVWEKRVCVRACAKDGDGAGRPTSSRVRRYSGTTHLTDCVNQALPEGIGQYCIPVRTSLRQHKRYVQ